MKLFALLAGLALAAAAAGGVVVYAGWYDISATDQHLAPTYRLLEYAMKRSVKQRAESIGVPPLGDKGQLAQGFAHYKAHCVQCHGAPGVAPEPFAMGLTPAPANLAHSGAEWSPAALYWVIKEGIKMSAMPAWKHRMSEEDMWALVAFLKAMPKLSPADYRAMKAPAHRHAPETGAPGEPSADRGKWAIQQYLCVTCHEIPGIVGPNAPVGPPLKAMGERKFIAGQLPNTPENMARWLREPQAIAPGSAMPDLGVSERDARDIAAYLGTLR